MALRFGYGGFFAVIGIYDGWSMPCEKGNRFPPKTGPGAQFEDVLSHIGFVTPLMLASFVIGGLARP
ncbi:hypothetical protein [Croceicoccus pelagius]|uniref:Uncharacterized protein n=1 Tax=Croceicoccus pelagius TaxID=1703341 RepID=A0A917DLG7_9SPHN|nr:hypothetical protein [Croceicoccus pelagius]GGD45889.1 hypothetical protein GCM10010989_20110 [Croceicoccus pelagius]